MNRLVAPWMQRLNTRTHSPSTLIAKARGSACSAWDGDPHKGGILGGASLWWNKLPGMTWKIALTTLLAHKLRAGLSTIGVIIGSASIVLVVTAGLAGERYVVEQIE